MYPDELMTPWLEALQAELPGLDVFDIHTHTGSSDPDGVTITAPELIAKLETAGSRAAVFTTKEPDGYHGPNDRVLAEAAASDGSLVAFCRLNPHDDPVAEAERCLEAGARGIKLHPRAEEFTLDHPKIDHVFALAAERHVPILIHAGRGIPALGKHVLELCTRYEGARAILAHAGISDLAWLWRETPNRPNLFFDTAWWSPADLLALMALVPPGQVLYASDAPYAPPIWGVVTAGRCALQTGLSEEQVRSVMGGQAQRLVAWEEPLDLGPAPGASAIAPDPLLDRVYTYLVAAGMLMLREQSAIELRQLSRLACDVGEDAPQAAMCASILSLLDRVERHEKTTDRDAIFYPGTSLVMLAMCLSRTADVPLPPTPERVDVGERIH